MATDTAAASTPQDKPVGVPAPAQKPDIGQSETTAYANVAEARANLMRMIAANAQEARTPAVISYIVVIGFIAIVAFLLTGWSAETSNAQGATLQILNVCLGAIAAGFATVLNFWLGSSLGSRKKDATLQIQQAQGVVAAPLTPAPPGEARLADLHASETNLILGRAATASTLSLRVFGYAKDLEEARKYKEAIETSAAKNKLDASLICAIGSRESAWGLTLKPPGPSGTGDFGSRDPAKWGTALPPDGGGWGRGLLQIDYAQAFAKTEAWKDPALNIEQGSRELAENIAFFEKERNASVDPNRAGIAAYNCGRGNVVKAIADGRDVDALTTGHNYSADVMQRKIWFDQNPL